MALNKCQNGSEIGNQIDPTRQPDRYDPVTGSGRWSYRARLGSGTYGETWKAIDVHTNDVVCLKVCKEDMIKNDRRPNWANLSAVFQMHEEASVSMHLLHNPKHPQYDAEKADTLVRYLEDHTQFAHFSYAQTAAWMNPTKTWDDGAITLNREKGNYVVMEYLDYSTVRELLKKESCPRKLIYNVAQKTALAIDYLQSFTPELIHRDIRVHNIMANANQVKIIDFGLVIRCRPFFDVNPNSCLYVKCSNAQYWVPLEVTNAWRQEIPTVVNYAEPKSSFDVFSLGVLCIEMLSDPATFFKNSKKARVTASTSVGEAWKSLGLDVSMLEAMVSNDPYLRPRPMEVYTQLKSNEGAKVSPVGDMASKHLRESSVVKFLNAARRMCLLQTKPYDKKIEDATFRALLNAIVLTIKQGGPRRDACLEHLLAMVRADDLVEEKHARENYLTIIKFVDFALQTLRKRGNVCTSETKKEEHVRNYTCFLHAMRSTTAERITPFIEALWETHAHTIAPHKALSAPSDATASLAIIVKDSTEQYGWCDKILVALSELFPGLNRFHADRNGTEVTSASSHEIQAHSPSRKRKISASTTDDSESIEDTATSRPVKSSRTVCPVTPPQTALLHV